MVARIVFPWQPGKHVEASRSEFLRTIAQVASEEAHEIDGTSRNGECRRRLDNLNPLPFEGRGHKFESCRARQLNQRLIETVPKRAKRKLTKNSPTGLAYWRAIGG